MSLSDSSVIKDSSMICTVPTVPFAVRVSLSITCRGYTESTLSLHTHLQDQGLCKKFFILSDSPIELLIPHWMQSLAGHGGMLCVKSPKVEINIRVREPTDPIHHWKIHRPVDFHFHKRRHLDGTVLSRAAVVVCDAYAPSRIPSSV